MIGQSFKNRTAFFTFLVIGLFLIVINSSCDKVKNPYPKQFVDMDTTLLSGITFKEYKNTLWTNFSNNSNTLRNVLIEDFTGHKCVNCPYAAKTALLIEDANKDRVFVASIHSGPNGNIGFQSTSGTVFSRDFTNPQGLEISKLISDGGFVGNPSGTINRTSHGGQIFQNYTTWDNYSSSIITENILKVNLQSIINYFPTTRGVFLHTEVDVKTAILDDLYQVVYLIEDSLISPQTTPSDWPIANLDMNYVHHDIHRGCIDGKAEGRKLTSDFKKDKDGKTLTGDKYYLNYSYKLPDAFNPDNMHLLIFVYNKSTKEIYQVIRKDIP